MSKTSLPVIQDQQEKKITNIINAMRDLQQALFNLIRASSYCAKAELPELSNNLRHMAGGVKTIKTHLDNIYKRGPKTYNNIKQHADLEIVIGECNE